MKRLADFASERRRAIKRSLRQLLGAAASAGEHLVLLKQALRENREAEAELRDALLARALLAQQQLPADHRALMDEWDAIESQMATPGARRAALRNLFSAVAARAIGRQSGPAG